MVAYAVGLFKMHDRSWIEDYKDPVAAVIAKHGGRYLARARNSPWELLEGTQPDISAINIIEFPSMEAARAWHSDVEYQPFIKLRQGGSQMDMMLVQGSDE